MISCGTYDLHQYSSTCNFYDFGDLFLDFNPQAIAVGGEGWPSEGKRRIQTCTQAGLMGNSQHKFEEIYWDQC